MLSERSTPRPTASGRAPSAPASTTSSSPRSSARPPTARPATGGVWLNNKYATTGACEIKLHAGDQVLFAVDSVKKHEHPLGIIAPAKAKAGKAFKLRVVSYSDKGKATPLAGASFKGAKGKTDKQGKLTVTVLSAKQASVTFTGSEKGYIRAAATVKIS